MQATREASPCVAKTTMLRRKKKENRKPVSRPHQLSSKANTHASQVSTHQGIQRARQSKAERTGPATRSARPESSTVRPKKKNNGKVKGKKKNQATAITGRLAVRARWDYRWQALRYPRYRSVVLGRTTDKVPAQRHPQGQGSKHQQNTQKKTVG